MLEVEINSIFQDKDGVLRYRRGAELARILRQLALRVQNNAGFEPGEGATVLDINGNEVGKWVIHE